MKKVKRLIVAVVILAVIVVMALRGCPRVRRSAGIEHEPATAVVTGIAGTARAKLELTRYTFISER